MSALKQIILELLITQALAENLGRFQTGRLTKSNNLVGFRAFLFTTKEGKCETVKQYVLSNDLGISKSQVLFSNIY